MTTIAATYTDTDLDRPHLLVAEAAAAVARSLPARALMVHDAPLGGVGGELLPGPSARAVTARVVGEAQGQLVLMVSAELIEHLRNDPFGGEDLIASLEPALAAALAALASVVGKHLELSTPQEIEAAALDLDSGVVAIALSDGDDHAATLVVSLSEPTATTAEFTPLVEQRQAGDPGRSLEVLHDVEMAVTVELGRTRMAVRDLLALAPGSVIELDRAAGSPVDVLVNGKLIARGEVVVIDEEFAIRISDIVRAR